MESARDICLFYCNFGILVPFLRIWYLSSSSLGYESSCCDFTSFQYLWVYFISYFIFWICFIVLWHFVSHFRDFFFKGWAVISQNKQNCQLGEHVNPSCHLQPAWYQPDDQHKIGAFSSLCKLSRHTVTFLYISPLGWFISLCVFQKLESHWCS